MSDTPPSLMELHRLTVLNLIYIQFHSDREIDHERSTRYPGDSGTILTTAD